MDRKENQPAMNAQFEEPATLEGLVLPSVTHSTGEVEKGVLAQVERLKADGWITAHHAGQVALVIRAARDVDQSAGKGAPSGRANLLRVMNEILSELPAPADQTGDALDKALAAMSAHQPAPAITPFVPGS